MTVTLDQIKKAYPEDAEKSGKGYFYPTGDYQPMLELFGTIILQVDDEDYQGDSRLIYRKYAGSRQHKYGLLIFGWGSCSGCDALQDCNSIEDMARLANDLENDIKWFDTGEELTDYLVTKDHELEWYGRDENTQRFIRAAVGLLGPVEEAA